MRSLLLVTAAALLMGAAPAKKLLTPSDIVAGAPAGAWRTIPADDLLILDIASGGRVVIQLAPAFAPTIFPSSLGRSKKRRRPDRDGDWSHPPAHQRCSVTQGGRYASI